MGVLGGNKDVLEKIKKGKLRTEEGSVVISEQYQAPLKINGVFPNNKQEKRVLTVFLLYPTVSK